MHETYKELLGSQRAALQAFTDRLDTLISKQNDQARDIRSEMRTDFSRVVDRQDSHFRWLAGLVVASALAVALAIYKAHL